MTSPGYGRRVKGNMKHKAEQAATQDSIGSRAPEETRRNGLKTRVWAEGFGFVIYDL
jgi:hypothetical protein